MQPALALVDPALLGFSFGSSGVTFNVALIKPSRRRPICNRKEKCAAKHNSSVTAGVCVLSVFVWCVLTVTPSSLLHLFNYHINTTQLSADRKKNEQRNFMPHIYIKLCFFSCKRLKEILKYQSRLHEYIFFPSVMLWNSHFLKSVRVLWPVHRSFVLSQTKDKDNHRSRKMEISLIEIKFQLCQKFRMTMSQSDNCQHLHLLIGQQKCSQNKGLILYYHTVLVIMVAQIEDDVTY